MPSRDFTTASLAAIAALTASNHFNAAHARDAVVVGDMALNASFEIQIEGSTGPMTLPGSHTEVTRDDPHYLDFSQITSIASNGNAVFFTGLDFRSETYNLFQMPLAGGPLELISRDVGQSSVVSAGNNLLLARPNETFDRIDILKQGSDGTFVTMGSTNIQMDPIWILDSPLAGYNTTSNELIVYAENSTDSKDYIHAISLNDFTKRTAEINPVDVFPRFESIVVNSQSNQAYLPANNHNWGEEGSTIELSELTIQNDAPPFTRKQNGITHASAFLT